MNTGIPAGLIAIMLGLPVLGAGQDDNIEWNGISHIEWHDRRPLCPRNGEAFEVRFQAYRDDLTGARVRVNDGSAQFIDASVIGSRGPYDIWSAMVPATASNSLGYVIELTDGTDIDWYSTAGVTDSAPAGSDFELNFSTLEHAPVGATPVSGGTVFKVWSPNSTTVHVRGQFNNWSTANPMTKVGEHFITFVPGAVAGHQYKYFFNNNHWNTDARARRVNPTDNYNSFIIDPLSYQWQTPPFAPPPFEHMVIYQLHVGSFAGRNDPYGPAPNPSRYRDVGDRAAHLADLGVNAVMLNPINEFPGDFSGGYNPVSKYAVEWKLGTPDDLKYMIDQLHAHGIAVILDIVWNHFSFSDNFMWFYNGTQLYFDSPHVDTPWGAQADFDPQGVRDYFLDSVVVMLDEYRMDGFRMDATSFMNIQASGWSLMQDLNDLVDRRFADKIMIAEQLPDDPWVTRPTVLGGAGFDAQYYDRFTDDLRSEIFDAAFGDPEMWKIRDIINGGGQYLSGRQVVNYFELHDECWTLSGGQRAVRTIDTAAPHDDQFARGRTMLAQGLTLLAPGIPAFLMGTEWLEDAGFESEKIDWSHKTTYAGVFAYYHDLIALRTGEPGFYADAAHAIVSLNDGANVIAFTRTGSDGRTFLIVANFSNTDWGAYRFGLPEAGTWEELVNSQSIAYGGGGFVNDGPIESEPIPNDGFDQSAVFRIGAMSLSVYARNKSAPVCPGDANGDQSVDIADLNTVLGNFGSGASPGDVTGDGATDVLDLNAVLGNFGAACN